MAALAVSGVLSRCRSAQPRSDPTCKATLLGDAGVGQTALSSRFVTGLYDSNYKGTIGIDFFVEKMTVLGRAFRLQIWDTAGQERFRTIARQYYSKCNVVILA